MNDRFLKATGLSLGAFLILFAANGKAFFEALLGFPALVQAWSAVLPLGAGSFLLAVVVAMGVWAFAMRYMNLRPDGRRPNLGADTVTFLAAIAVTVTQVIGKDAGAILQALWMGIAAGSAASFLCRVVGSIHSRVKDKP